LMIAAVWLCQEVMYTNGSRRFGDDDRDVAPGLGLLEVVEHLPERRVEPPIGRVGHDQPGGVRFASSTAPGRDAPSRPPVRPSPLVVGDVSA